MDKWSIEEAKPEEGLLPPVNPIYCGKSKQEKEKNPADGEKVASN